MISAHNDNEDLDNLRWAAMNGHWTKVLEMYEDKRELRLAKITKGDTVLHMAVSNGKEYVVEFMVDIVCENGKSTTYQPGDENGNEKKAVLGAKNEKGNTPLHLAAAIGNVRMCKKIVGEDSSLITSRNSVGDTPLFMAALHGHKKAFLFLHYLYMNSSQGSSTHDALHKNNDNDTILHHAVAGGHIGFFRVKKKKMPTTRDELEQSERESCIRSCIESLQGACEECSYAIYDGGSSWFAMIRRLISYSLDYLFIILLFPLLALDYLFTAAGNWFRRIRNMKEKHTWSLQIMKQLLSIDSCKPLFEKSYEEKSEEGSKIVDTPLLIAAKNGVVEMVERILKEFPDAMKVVNKEGKNIVLLAAEKRQTKLYQSLCGNEIVRILFKQVDNDGNTALHLASKPGINLDWEETTMVEEYRWFEFVRCSVPSELREKYNNAGKTAKEIFRDSYKELMESDRQWLYQTSQTCSVASTLVASMAFSNIVSDKFDEKNYSTLVALSLSLTSTISFLAILAIRSQSLTIWRRAHFMLQIAIWTMFGSIVTLWITLVLNAKSSPATYAILGMPIAILTIVSLPTFMGPTWKYCFAKVPAPNRNTTGAIYYQRRQKEEIAADSNPQTEKIATDSNPQN